MPNNFYLSPETILFFLNAAFVRVNTQVNPTVYPAATCKGLGYPQTCDTYQNSGVISALHITSFPPDALDMGLT